MTRPPHVWELDCGPADVALAAAQDWLLAGRRQNRSNGRAEKLPPVIKDGAWHTTMVSAAGTLRARGFTEQAAVAALLEQNATYDGGLSDDGGDVRALVADVYERYQADREIELQRAYDGPERALDDVVATFRRHLHLPDPAPLLLTLAAAVANMMEEGDPVWLVNVGGSSRGKTEIVAALDGFPGVRVVGALTVAGLLSGTARKERAKNATGGVLSELGDRGILVVKDFGALLTLHRDARAQVLQALRDVYDGLYTRDVGVDGGTKLRWEGRLGLIAGATSALDSAHAVVSALGERWVTVRLPDGGEGEMAHVALGNSDTRAARAELRDAVHGFLATLESVPLRQVDAAERKMLVALSSLVCIARSPVERDPYKRDIVYVHNPEGPARIVRQLHKLLVALEAMGVAEPGRVIVRAGLDSIPSPRRAVLTLLLEQGEQSTSEVAVALHLPGLSARRALEELVVHGMLSRRKKTDADNSPDLWAPAEHASAWWQAISRAEG